MINKITGSGTVQKIRQAGFFNICLFFLGLALPLSTALVTTFLALIFIGLAITYKRFAWFDVSKEPIIYLAIILFLWLALSLTWSSGGTPDDYLSKYRKLLYILPLAALFVFSTGGIKYFISGFLAASVIALIFSYYFYITGNPIGYGIPGNAAVVKKDITHNFFMAIAVVFLITQWRSYLWTPHRIVLVLLLLSMLANIYFMVDGRTGQVTLLVALLIWIFFESKISSRYQLSVLLGMASLFLVSLYILSRQQSYVAGIEEIRQCYAAWQGGLSIFENCYSSMGARSSFLFTAIDIVAGHPMGIGVGGFPEEVLGRFHNPHNDYILYLIQLGWLGLIVYILWVLRAVFLAFCGKQNRSILLAFLGMYLVGNMFNSFSLDFNEGHLFVVLMAYLGALGVSRRLSAGNQ